MKGKEPPANGQNDQPAESEQQTPASKNGVFLKCGKGQSFDEFKKACIASLISAGLIKTVKDTPSESLPDKREIIQ